jgi:hypothetical protein
MASRSPASSAHRSTLRSATWMLRLDEGSRCGCSGSSTAMPRAAQPLLASPSRSGFSRTPRAGRSGAGLLCAPPARSAPGHPSGSGRACGFFCPVRDFNDPAELPAPFFLAHGHVGVLSDLAMSSRCSLRLRRALCLTHHDRAVARLRFALAGPEDEGLTRSAGRRPVRRERDGDVPPGQLVGVEAQPALHARFALRLGGAWDDLRVRSRQGERLVQGELADDDRRCVPRGARRFDVLRLLHGREHGDRPPRLAWHLAPCVRK